MLIQIRNIGSCSAWQSVDQYVMRGPSGEHVLSRDVTDRNRFEAHWKGFCENNGERYEREAETLGEFVEQAKQLSRDVVRRAKRQHGGYIRPRELRLAAGDSDGNLIGEPWYCNSSQLTQKFIKLVVLTDPKAASFSIGAGADWYESFQAALEGWDYEPEVQFDEIELPRKLVEEILK